jgi:hypothetical protein
LSRELEKQRQEFKKLQQEIDKSGNNRSSARGTSRSAQQKP